MVTECDMNFPENNFPRVRALHWHWLAVQALAYITLGVCLGAIAEKACVGAFGGVVCFCLSRLLHTKARRSAGHFVGWTTLGASFSYALTGSIEPLTMGCVLLSGMMPLFFLDERAYRPYSFSLVSFSVMVLFVDASPFVLGVEMSGAIAPFVFWLLPMCGALIGWWFRNVRGGCPPHEKNL
jgi:hypothetical protein